MKHSTDVKTLQQTDDEALVEAARNGSSSALEELIKRHRPFIYNVALRMCGAREDADDATQEIFIKVITKLSTFKGESGFRTWLYRIAVNHVLNMKRSRKEEIASSFDRHKKFLDNIPDGDLGHTFDNRELKRLLAEETKSQCLAGMILCLDRRERLVFTAGGIFDIRSSPGGKMLDITPANFRKILSRSRKKLRNYMNDNCGLINKNNSCRCEKKTSQLVERGIIDPENLEFTSDRYRRISDFVNRRSGLFKAALRRDIERVFRDQPFVETEKNFDRIKRLIDEMESIDGGAP